MLRPAAFRLAALCTTLVIGSVVLFEMSHRTRTWKIESAVRMSEVSQDTLDREAVIQQERQIRNVSTDVILDDVNAPRQTIEKLQLAVDESEVKGFYPLANADTVKRRQLKPEEMLLPDLIAADVHYLWCGDRWFEFKHYLSVMSVRRALLPDKIYIHYVTLPSVDRPTYNSVNYPF